MLSSVAILAFVAAILTVVLISGDSAELVAVPAVVGGSLAVEAVGLFVRSVVLDGCKRLIIINFLFFKPEAGFLFFFTFRG